MGFDERFAAEKPSMQALLAAIEEGFARHDRRMDLGGGGQDYKYRLADGEDTVGLPPAGRARPPLPADPRCSWRPARRKRAVGRHLPDGVRSRLRRG